MTRTTTAVVAAILTALGGAAAAQSPAPSAVMLESGGTVLNVTAEGRAQRQPDLVTFNAGVVTQARTAAEALSANAERMDAVTAALKRAGVAEKDLQTATLSIQPQYFYPQPERRPDGSTSPAAPQPPSIIGYEARNTVTAKVRQVAGVGRIIDALAQAGANQVDGPYFTVENPEPATDEARAQAMAVARKRAELYARAAGLRVTRILTITEGGGYYPVTREIIVTGGMAAAPSPAPPPPPSSVQAGEITLGANLSVQFLLER